MIELAGAKTGCWFGRFCLGPRRVEEVYSDPIETSGPS